jgi:hypothetical protein
MRCRFTTILPYRFEHHAYPGAGHVIEPGAPPNMTQFKHPLGFVVILGGSRQANAAAQKQAWAATLEFLRAPLRPSATAASR